MRQKAVQVIAVFYNSELNNVIITNKVAQKRENVKLREWEWELQDTIVYEKLNTS